ncbi:MAG: M23 family metallopeptidase [Elusimicrobia bacterium]|nr:M23 family metallopeptidase [Candidatus Liberimonas magnetica]
MIKKIILLLFISINLFGQNLDSPGNWEIISDYGPRNVANSWFHYGIDYAGSEGESIKTVESGAIKKIEWDDNGGGFYIGMIGTTGYWTYLHIFNGVKDDHPLPKTSGNWKLQAVVLERQDTNESIESTVIILYSGSKIQKVLSTYNNRWVKDSSGSYLLDSSGNKITTQSTVSAGEAIAPVGTSGGVGAHCHLGCRPLEASTEKDNPLQYVSHETSNFKATILSPKGAITKSQAHSPIPIKLRINSSTGLDLDKAEIFLDGTEAASKIASFIYGGRNDETSTNNAKASSGETTGWITYRVSPYGTTAGYDDFVIDSYDFSLLPQGNHSITIHAADVHKEEFVYEFNLNIGDRGMEGERTTIYSNGSTSVEQNPFVDCGMNFTGSYFHSGYAGATPDYVEVTDFSVSQENVPIENLSKIEFSFDGCGGGAKALADLDRYVGLYVTFKDENGYYHESTNVCVFRYDEPEDSPAYNPKTGLETKSITISELMNKAGVGNAAWVKYVDVVLSSSMENSFCVDSHGNICSGTPLWAALKSAVSHTT